MWIQRTPRNLHIISAPDILANGMADDERQALKNCFDEFGCLVVEDVFNQAYIDDLKKQFDEQYAHFSVDQLDQHNYKISERRYHITLPLTSPFDNPALYANPLLLELAGIFLEQNFVLDSYVAVQSLPGSQKQRPHRDVPPLFSDEIISQTLPCYAITMILPLVDINVQCGTTALWPGSHRDMIKKHGQVDTPILPLIKRGSVYLWDYRLVHAGMANNADYARPILSLVYSRPWFLDSENFTTEPQVYLTKSDYEKIPDNAKFLFSKFRWQIKD